MTVTEIQHVEDCFDGSFIKEFFLDETITEPFIRYLGKDKKLEYFPEFARPFFRIIAEDEYMIKGIEENRYVKVIIFPSAEKDIIEQIRAYINKFHSFV